MSQTNDKANEREFFRNTGVVYLQVRKIDAPVPEQHQIPDELDDFALKLMNLANKIRYELTEENFLTPVTELLLHLHLQNVKKEAQESAVSEKKTVVISASGLDFPERHVRAPGSQWMLKLTFPHYPFETVDVKAEVVSQKQEEGGHRTIMKFVDATDHIQETIIKFVNQLTRDQKKGVR